METENAPPAAPPEPDPANAPEPAPEAAPAGLAPAALAALMAAADHTFGEPRWLEQALTHPSWVRDHPGAGEHNQRLEFLGDAILGAVLAADLFARFPHEREGGLSRRRIALARREALAAAADALGLPACLRLGPSESGGRHRVNLRADAFEALAGAVFLDGGWEAARRFVLGALARAEAAGLLAAGDSAPAALNPKGALQEAVQPALGNEALAYALVAAEGPDHDRRFIAAVTVHGQTYGTGGGRSKKEAEENAARAALARWQAEQDAPVPAAQSAGGNSTSS